MEQTKIFLEMMEKNFSIDTALSVNEGLKKLDNNDYDAVVSDYQMPITNGLEFLEILRKERNSEIPFLMFTGRGREEVAMKALNIGANRYIQKGGDPKSQYSVLADAIDQEIRLYLAEQAKNRLSSIVESSQNAIIGEDLDGTIFSWNKGAEKIYGYKEEEVVGKSISILAPEGKKEEIEEILEKVKDGVWIDPFETERLSKYDKKIPVSLTVSPILNQKGEVIAASAIAQDITKRRKAEEKIRFHSKILNNMDEVVYLVRAMDNIIVYTNPAFKKIFDYESDEMVGKHISKLFSSTEDVWSNKIVKTLKTTEKWEGEVKNIRKDGTPFWGYMVISTYDHPEYGPTWIAVHTDISIVKESEKEIKNLNRALRLLSKVNSLIVNADDEIKLLDETCEAIVDHLKFKLAWVGYALNDEEKTIVPITYRGYEKGYLESIELSWGDNEYGQGPVGTAIRNEKPVINKDVINSQKYEPLEKEIIQRGYRSSVSLPIKVRNKVIGALNIYDEEPDAFGEREMDILMEAATDLEWGIININIQKEKNETKNRLQEAIKRYRKITEISPNAIILVNRDTGIITDANRYSEILTGYGRNEIIGRYYVNLHPIYERSSIYEIFNDDSKNSNLGYSGEYNIIGKDKKTVPVEIRIASFIIGGENLVYFSINDITEIKKARERQDFLHSLLRHDFKNRIQVIKGYLELLKESDLPPEIEKFVEKPLISIRECTDLLRNIDMLQKLKKGEREEIDIESIIKQSIIDRQDRAEDLDIVIRYEPKKCKVIGGPLLLESFSNIIENAMIHSDCNIIRITNSSQKNECIITIEDDGKGIPCEVTEEVFKKGFSTGDKNCTGLGLYLVREIIESYGGMIEYRDSEFGGARFDIHLKISHGLDNSTQKIKKVV